MLVMLILGPATVHSPPVIAPDLRSEMSFKERERVELPCVASGDPPPS